MVIKNTAAAESKTQEQKDTKNSKSANKSNKAKEQKNIVNEETTISQEESLINLAQEFLGLEIKINNNKFEAAKLKDIISQLKKVTDMKFLLLAAMLEYMVELSEKHKNNIPASKMKEMTNEALTPDMKLAIMISLIQSFLHKDVSKKLAENHKEILACTKSTVDANGKEFVKGKKYVLQVLQMPKNEDPKRKVISEHIKNKNYQALDTLLANEPMQVMNIDHLQARLQKLQATIYESVSKINQEGAYGEITVSQGVEHVLVFKILTAENLVFENTYAEMGAMHTAKLELEIMAEGQRLLLKALSGSMGVSPEALEGLSQPQ